MHDSEKPQGLLNKCKWFLRRCIDSGVAPDICGVCVEDAEVPEVFEGSCADEVFLKKR